jgi:hypothetical protein
MLPAPTATLQIRVEADGLPVSGFEFRCTRADGLHLQSSVAEGDRLQVQLPLTVCSDGDAFELAAGRPPLGDARAHVRLQAGQLREVVLELGSAIVVAGTVVDASGFPVVDALVTFGTLERLRGDEPFKPFRPARIREGVRTDAAGCFALSGTGDGAVHLPQARPGKYWLLTNAGPIAALHLRTRTAEVEAGFGVLTVRGVPGRRGSVIPAGAGELMRVMAARPNAIAIGEDGTARFRTLPAGVYDSTAVARP